MKIRASSASKKIGSTNHSTILILATRTHENRYFSNSAFCRNYSTVNLLYISGEVPASEWMAARGAHIDYSIHLNA
ncbi:hypothetical protein PENTCL1PPCAC_19062 [Pristionchus entomophagus]|uniref:Uncharacterized protein n=1 Tax=Pristionchus entomophagus TaxID=358040 RepID=A0AAV5TRS6_9BILA|nr:hypothetical protein PENTCL1PPCAC_19062 [Pristionchus entomophagus]